mmetsp:Transcript_71486/g.145129  ORF Transcript_71486/g.145129 Transcript_71486/m.145129 type:complete len:268 (+) Transcript_71486:1174-1977(+)
MRKRCPGGLAPLPGSRMPERFMLRPAVFCTRGRVVPAQAQGRVVYPACALLCEEPQGPQDLGRGSFRHPGLQEARYDLFVDIKAVHRAIRILLLTVHFHLLHERLLIGVRRLPRSGLATALGLLLLLEPVLGVHESDDLLLVKKAHVGREHKRLAVFHPTHLLQHIHCVGYLHNAGLNLGVGELDAAELLVRRIAHDVAGQLVDELQDLLRLRQWQRVQGLLQRRERIYNLVARRVASVSHRDESLPRWSAVRVRGWRERMLTDRLP